MYLAIVHPAPVWGGAERYTADVAIGLAERDHDVTAIVAPESPLAHALRGSRVRIVEFDAGLLVGWHHQLGFLNQPLFAVDLYLNPRRARLGRCLDQLRAERPIDLLLAQHPKEKLWVTAYGKAASVPVVWTVHAPLEAWMRTGVVGRVHRDSVGRLSGIVAVNQAAADDYVSFGFPSDIVEVVWNGIPLGDYASGDRESMRTTLGVTQGESVVLMPARPHREKGVDVMLEALARVRAAGLRVRAIFAGESRRVDEYRSLAEGRGLSDSAVFLGHRDDMADLYAASDIVVLPSFNEGLPYVISEAMAASRPVVATSVGGVGEMVEDGVSGILVPPGDSEALADALKELAADADLREVMGAAGRSIAERRFRLDVMLDGTDVALQRTVDRSRSDAL